MNNRSLDKGGGEDIPHSEAEGSSNEPSLEERKALSRRRAIKVLGAAAGLGGLLTVGGGIVGKHLVESAQDAGRQTIDDVTNREMEERTAQMEAFLENAVDVADTLAKEILDFLYLLKGKVDNWEDASDLVLTLWHGLSQDLQDAITTDGEDLSPDSIVESVRNIVESDPELSESWDRISEHIEVLRAMPLGLEALKQDLSEFDEQDQAEAWDDFERNFWKEVMEPFRP